MAAATAAAPIAAAATAAALPAAAPQPAAAVPRSQTAGTCLLTPTSVQGCLCSSCARNDRAGPALVDAHVTNVACLLAGTGAIYLWQSAATTPTLHTSGVSHGSGRDELLQAGELSSMHARITGRLMCAAK